jgi:hypothetical protein
MTEIAKEMQALTEKALGPIQSAFFFSTDEYHPYTCIHSSITSYREDKMYSIYDLFSLIRVLAIKAELWSDELRDKYYQQSNNEIAFVLEWDEHSKKVLLLNIENAQASKEQIAVEVQRKRTEISNLLQKAFYIKRGERV